MKSERQDETVHRWQSIWNETIHGSDGSSVQSKGQQAHRVLQLRPPRVPPSRRPRSRRAPLSPRGDLPPCKVEAPAVVSDLLSEPHEPLLDVGADKLLGVVDVGCSVEEVAWKERRRRERQASETDGKILEASRRQTGRQKSKLARRLAVGREGMGMHCMHA